MKHWLSQEDEQVQNKYRKKMKMVHVSLVSQVVADSVPLISFLEILQSLAILYSASM